MHGEEDLERGAFEDLADVLKLEAEAHVRRVEAERAATEVRAIHPLHREARVRMELFGPYGKPAKDARAARFRVDGRVGSVVRDSSDRAGVGGIPFLPGEAVEMDTRLPHWFGSADDGAVEMLSLFGRQGERAHLRARPKRRQSPAETAEEDS